MTADGDMSPAKIGNVPEGDMYPLPQLKIADYLNRCLRRPAWDLLVLLAEVFHDVYVYLYIGINPDGPTDPQWSYKPIGFINRGFINRRLLYSKVKMHTLQVCEIHENFISKLQACV